jgi:hypothetical protein
VSFWGCEARPVNHQTNSTVNILPGNDETRSLSPDGGWSEVRALLPVIDGLIALSSAMLGRWEQIARDHHVDLEGLDVRRSQEVVERREEDRPPSALGDTQPRPSPSAGKSDEGAGPTPGRRHY